MRENGGQGGRAVLESRESLLGGENEDQTRGIL